MMPFSNELLQGGSFGQKAFAGIDPANVPSSASASGAAQCRKGHPTAIVTRPLGDSVDSRALSHSVD